MYIYVKVHALMIIHYNHPTIITTTQLSLSIKYQLSDVLNPYILLREWNHFTMHNTLDSNVNLLFPCFRNCSNNLYFCSNFNEKNSLFGGARCEVIILII